MPERLYQKHALLERIGDLLVETFHLVGLFVIGGITIYSAALELVHMFEIGKFGLKEILLLFIYLEIGAMVGIYFKTHKLPVRFLIYITITAITRVLVVDIKTMTDMHIITMTGAVLLLSLAIVMLRFASWRYPTDQHHASESNSRDKHSAGDV